MPLNNFGFHEYAPTDAAAPFDELLNLLVDSLTAAVGPYVADTDWVAIPLRSGFTAVTGDPPQVRRIGPSVHCRGAATGTGTAGTTLVADLPALPGSFPLAGTFRPGQPEDMAVYLGSGTFYRATLSTAGVFGANNVGAGVAFTYRFSPFDYAI